MNDIESQADSQIRLAEFFLRKAREQSSDCSICCNYYEKSATIFKYTKLWKRAGATYVELAEYLELRFEEANEEDVGYYKDEAARAYADSAFCFMEVDYMNEVFSLLQKAAKLFKDIEMDIQAAECFVNLAELYETNDITKAIKCYIEAADLGGLGADANRWRAKAAQLAAIHENFDLAITIYEEMAKNSRKLTLMIYGAKHHLLNAGICRLCKGDIDEINSVLEKYQEIDKNFSRTREYEFLKGIADSMKDKKFDKVFDACKQYEEWTPLDTWKRNLVQFLAGRSFIINENTIQSQGQRQRVLESINCVDTYLSGQMELLSFLKAERGADLYALRDDPAVEVFKVTIVQIADNVSNLYGTISVGRLCEPTIYYRSRDNPEYVRCDDQITLTGPECRISATNGFILHFDIKDKGSDQSLDKEVIKGKVVDSYICDTPVTEVVMGEYGVAKIEYVVISKSMRAFVQLKLINLKCRNYADDVGACLGFHSPKKSKRDSVHLCGSIIASTTKFIGYEIVLLDIKRSEPMSLSLNDLVPLRRSFVVVPKGSELKIQAFLRDYMDPLLESGTSSCINDTTVHIPPPCPHTSEEVIDCGVGQFKMTIRWLVY